MFSEEQLRKLIEGQTIGEDYPYNTNDKEEIEEYIKRLYYRIKSIHYGHIQSLKKYIGIEKLLHTYFIIVFTQLSTLKFKEPFISAKVIQIPQLLNVIKERNEVKISSRELQKINQ